MDEKRMPFMNFKIVKAKNLKTTTKMWHLFTEILIISWHTEI